MFTSSKVIFISGNMLFVSSKIVSISSNTAGKALQVLAQFIEFMYILIYSSIY